MDIPTNDTYEGNVEDWQGSIKTLSLGRDWQRGNLVYGLALSFSPGNLRAQGFTGVDINAFYTCTDCEVVVGNRAMFTGRVGFAAGRTLAYVAAGLARSDVTATALSGTFPIGNDTLSGHVYGLGVEFLVRPHVSVIA